MSASDEEEYFDEEGEEEEEEDLEEEEGEESEGEEDAEEENATPQENNEDVVDDLTYDTFNLTASLYHPLRWSNSQQKEQVILEAATRAAQLLYKRLSNLPAENAETGPVIVLPYEVAVLPRSRKVPEAKAETRWEKFAKERGIKKTKRDRMVYDEAEGEYKPRYGYKGINKGMEDVAIMEVKEGQDPFADPWTADRTAKRDRIKRNEKNQLRNLSELSKKKKNGKKSYDPSSVPGIPIELNTSSGKRGKSGVRKALEVVQQSTASLGRYDEMRPGEPTRKLSGKKRSFRDNFTPFSDEQTTMKAQVRFVADKKQKKAKGVTNSLAAYEGILPDAPGLAFKKSKGRGKNANVDTKKKGKR